MSNVVPLRKRPERRLDLELRDARNEHGGKKPEYDIHKTIVRARKDEGVDGAVASESLRPSDEQLAKINQFTRRDVTAEEVVVFPTMSCNDLDDRDDDRFSTQCVKDFAALEGTYSPVGKSFMLSHDYTKLPVGRIFDVGTENVDGATFLTNDVYIPNTKQNQDFIENVDFGIYWAVSVGVVLNAAQCTVGEPHEWGYFRWFCNEGHEKGLFYDPKSTEKDSWGYPIPVESNTPGAVKSIREMFQPRDFYELSMVYLGAQYYAELADKSPELAGIIKAASAKSIPVIGLKQEEAAELPLRHVPDKLKAASSRFTIEELEDGQKRWVDDERLVWLYNPEDDGVTCLGRSEEAAPESAEPPNPSEASSEDAPGVEGTPPEETSVPKITEGDDEVDLKAVIAAATKAKLPSPLLERFAEISKAVENPENFFNELFVATSKHISSLQEELKQLEPKAAAGDAYVKDVRADVIHWYAMAMRDPANPEKGVNTDSVERLLDKVGDDLDVLKELREQYQTTARAKFPEAVRRSSFPTDPHERAPEGGGEGVAPFTDMGVVTRIHG